jgi:hypothetical protein
MEFKRDLVADAGHVDFSPYDRLVDHLSRAGARPLFILDYGHPRHDGGQAPRSEEARAALRALRRVRGGLLPRSRRALGNL